MELFFLYTLTGNLVQCVAERLSAKVHGITRVEVEEKKQGKIKTEEGKMRDISLLVLGITTIDTSR